MTGNLDRLARAHGILTRYETVDGGEVAAPDETVATILSALGVNPRSSPPSGKVDRPDLEMRAPPEARCHLPDFLDNGRAWGVTCQLYGLRSQRNWGIGDFEDLARLGEILASYGADFLGINPLHAPFLGDPDRASPFSPADRLFLNPLMIAVDTLPGFDPARDADMHRVALLRQGNLVNYPAIANAKLPALRSVHARRGARGGDEAAFIEEGGQALYRHALFQALSIEMVRQGHGAGWTGWPEAFRDPDSAAVADFAGARVDEIDFQLWLQFVADRQLADTARRLREAGMRIGLYMDLAVGTAPDGSATWRDRGLNVTGVEIGAPKDLFNPNGQNWGLAPLSPEEMIARDMAPAREAYRSAIRHAGALRIDHAMSVHRLFWIPEGAMATDGAYVLYPMPGLMRALSEASQHRQALIVGEDLGTVPDGFREEMARAGMLGYRLFFFERDEDGFVPPASWPRDVLACIGSHDTATLAGWWTGNDIATRRAAGLYDRPETERVWQIRRGERHEAMGLLQRHGVEALEDRYDTVIAAGLHRLIASTPCRLFAVQLEDLTGEIEQPNLPGTTDEHPNWQRRLSVGLERLADDPTFQAVLTAVAAERPRRQ